MWRLILGNGNRGFGVTSPPAPFSVGMKRQNRPRMHTAGRSTDRAVPIDQTPGSSQDSRNDGNEGFPCRAPNCGQSFTTKIGRGVHENRAHPDWYDQQKMNLIGSKKDRWSEEEKEMLARKEAQLTKSGVKFLNQELVKFFDRTLESVKGQRRKAEHKEKVLWYMEEIESQSSEDSSEDEDYTSAEEGNDSGITEREELSMYLQTLEPLRGDVATRLNTICQMTSWRSKDDVAVELALYIRELLPGNERSNSAPKSTTNQDAHLNSKQRRREEYARVQDLWKKGPSQCIKRILTDQLQQEEALEKEVMEPFWRTVMTKGTVSLPNLPETTEKLERLWSPVLGREIKAAYPPNKTASGPDGIKAKQLKTIPTDILARICTLFMWCGKLPEFLLKSRTVLIPKKKGASEPGDFRPITVSSVLVRLFHKILANRLKVVKLDERQRAFRDTDGCSDNIMLLDMALKYHHKKNKKMFMAILDMAKAFDSVSFKALEAVLRAKGLPGHMVSYVMGVYDSSRTILQHGGWESDNIHPSCGVKQGDPLSPLLFNFIMDEMLKSVTPEIGVDIDGYKMNILAFADDLILMTATERGLQSLIDQVTGFLSECGLMANAGKCATLAIKSVPKLKKTAIDSSCAFKIGRAKIPSLKRTDEWKYLGVQFTAEGRVQTKIKDKLQEDLIRLTRAPLKPQQRLWALRTIVVPSTLYQLTLGGVTLGYLRSMDKKIRNVVRKWLHLPHESPNGYVHARIEDGGLGIPSIRWRAPAERFGRIKALLASRYVSSQQADSYLNEELRKVEHRLKDNTNCVLDTNAKINEFWAKCLYKTFDGLPLRNSAQVKEQHRWVGDCTRFLSGKDFVQSCKARINALPTRARTSRGQAKERHCRGGCGKLETINHIVQQCHRTHGPRILRHDAVVNYLAKNLIKAGYNVEKEPHFQTTEGLRKPDIVAAMGVTSVILDAQVMSEQTDLQRANSQKACKYDIESLKEKVRERNKSANVIVIGVTLSWRGLWCKKSVEDLRRLGAIRSVDIKIISSRVIIGAIAAWNQFNRTTTVNGRRRRMGVG